MEISALPLLLLTLFSAMKRWKMQVLWKLRWDLSANLWRHTGALFGQSCQRHSEERWQMELCCALRLGSPFREEDPFRPVEELDVTGFLLPLPFCLWMEFPDLKVLRAAAIIYQVEPMGRYAFTKVITDAFHCTFHGRVLWKVGWTEAFWRRSSSNDNINALRIIMVYSVNYILIHTITDPKWSPVPIVNAVSNVFDAVWSERVQKLWYPRNNLTM